MSWTTGWFIVVEMSTPVLVVVVGVRARPEGENGGKKKGENPHLSHDPSYHDWVLRATPGIPASARPSPQRLDRGPGLS